MYILTWFVARKVIINEGGIVHEWHCSFGSTNNINEKVITLFVFFSLECRYFKVYMVLFTEIKFL